MEEQCSELFWNIFDSGCGGCIRTCECGVTHFDSFNIYDWEEGELDEMLEKAKAEPDRYKEHDCGIGTIEINGISIVWGCKCGIAKRYENFIRSHAVQLAKYLNETAKALRKKADLIEVSDG